MAIQENGEELEKISDIPSAFQLNKFLSFVLQQGRHELEVVSEVQFGLGNVYFLRDILIELNDTAQSQSNDAGMATIQDEDIPTIHSSAYSNRTQTPSDVSK